MVLLEEFEIFVAFVVVYRNCKQLDLKLFCHAFVFVSARSSVLFPSQNSLQI